MNMSRNPTVIELRSLPTEAFGIITLHSLKNGVVVITNASNANSTVHQHTIQDAPDCLVKRLDNDPNCVERDVYGAFLQLTTRDRGYPLRNSDDGNLDSNGCTLIDKGRLSQVLENVFEVKLSDMSGSLSVEDYVRGVCEWLDRMKLGSDATLAIVVKWIQDQNWDGLLPGIVIPHNNGVVEEIHVDKQRAVDNFLGTACGDKILLKRFVILNCARLTGVFFAIS